MEHSKFVPHSMTFDIIISQMNILVLSDLRLDWIGCYIIEYTITLCINVNVMSQLWCHPSSDDESKNPRVKFAVVPFFLFGFLFRERMKFNRKLTSQSPLKSNGSYLYYKFFMNKIYGIYAFAFIEFLKCLLLFIIPSNEVGNVLNTNKEKSNFIAYFIRMQWFNQVCL